MHFHERDQIGAAKLPALAHRHDAGEKSMKYSRPGVKSDAACAFRHVILILPLGVHFQNDAFSALSFEETTGDISTSEIG